VGLKGEHEKHRRGSKNHVKPEEHGLLAQSHKAGSFHAKRNVKNTWLASTLTGNGGLDEQWEKIDSPDLGNVCNLHLGLTQVQKASEFKSRCGGGNLIASGECERGSLINLSGKDSRGRRLGEKKENGPLFRRGP